MDHLYYMGKAIKLAKTALNDGEFPVGCLLVYQEQIIASGMRAGTSRHEENAPANEIDHAEMGALREFYQLGTPVDPGRTTLYCTMEPCLMCYAAILLSGIGTIVYAYEDVMGGGTTCNKSTLAPLYRERSIEIIPHIRRDESLALFKTFFGNNRNNYWENSLLAQHTLAQGLAKN
jgi:tRNA(adenine34) deaminase